LAFLRFRRFGFGFMGTLRRASSARSKLSGNSEIGFAFGISRLPFVSPPAGLWRLRRGWRHLGQPLLAKFIRKHLSARWPHDAQAKGC